MILKLENTWTTVIAADAGEVFWLADYLSHVDKSKLFRTLIKDVETGQYQRPRDENGELLPLPKITLLDTTNSRFPAGLTGHVLEGAKEAGIRVQVLDKRTRPDIVPQISLALEFFEDMARRNPKYETREYQVEAVRKILEAGRGILDLCTSAGKTLTAMAIVAGLPGVNWLFLVPSIDLYRQAKDAFLEAFPGETCGEIKGQKFVTSYFTVATFQTLSKKIQKGDPRVLKYLETVTGVFVDECHQSAAATQYSTLMSLGNAFYRVGLSGTPLKRSDGKNLYNMGVLGRVLLRVQSRDLIDKGYLAKPTVHLVPVEQVGPTSPDWQSDYQEYVVRSPKRLQVLAHTVRRVAEKGFGLIFCEFTEHGRAIAKTLQELGYRTKFLYGDDNGYRRKEAIKDLEEGSYDFLVVSKIFDTGVNIPFLNWMIFAGGKKGDIQTLQRVGRGLRKDEKTGKVTVDIYDIFDTVPEDSPIHEMGNRFNASHSKTRLGIYKKAGFDVVRD